MTLDLSPDIGELEDQALAWSEFIRDVEQRIARLETANRRGTACRSERESRWSGPSLASPARPATRHSSAGAYTDRRTGHGGCRSAAADAGCRQRRRRIYGRVQVLAVDM